MNINEYTNLIVQGYCDATGMPAASLSVNDYLQIRKAASEELDLAQKPREFERNAANRTVQCKSNADDTIRHYESQSKPGVQREQTRRESNTSNTEQDNIVAILNALPD